MTGQVSLNTSTVPKKRGEWEEEEERPVSTKTYSQGSKEERREVTRTFGRGRFLLYVRASRPTDHLSSQVVFPAFGHPYRRRSGVYTKQTGRDSKKQKHKKPKKTLPWSVTTGPTHARVK